MEIIRCSEDYDLAILCIIFSLNLEHQQHMQWVTCLQHDSGIILLAIILLANNINFVLR
uniref:Uncharacterized protein n=1 Tax=Anguilla anguilla TaxID=7936 RepID=A0A0E9R751_ANGAN